ncbi:hypothetical protein EVB27_045 [Rhizobium phage RHph_TM16]|nr:hypothetical protein EVB27_045 [Rhizobium phage RHph_TM16]
MVARVQNNGLARISSLLAAATWWLGWGTGSAAAASANAVTAPGEARVSATAAQATTTVANDTLRLTATITASATRAITEVGAFDASTAGNMDMYADFSAINLAAADSIAFTVDTKFA